MIASAYRYQGFLGDRPETGGENTPQAADWTAGTTVLDRRPYSCQRCPPDGVDMGVPVGSGRWLTLADAAAMLNTTSEAVRKRAKRQSLQSSRDNRGRLLVWVDDGVDWVDTGGSEVPDSGVPVQSGHGVPAVHLPSDDLVYELRQRMEDRDRQVEQLRTDLSQQQARADAQTARQLAERDCLHRDQIERLIAQAAAERGLWLERVDAAELRAERVEQRLDQVLDQLLRQPAPGRAEQAPWWRRWFGVSTKSKIGRP